jgi:hypothetical protein
VWQPDEDSNVCFAHFFYTFEARQTAIIVYSWLLYLIQQVHSKKVRQSSNSKKVRQITILICSGLLHPTGWAAQSSKTYYGFFFKDRETLREYNTAFIFDENERVKRDYHKTLTKCFVI